MQRPLQAVRWRFRAGVQATRRLPVRLHAWLGFLCHRSTYHVIDEKTLRATRKSDTVFIFGSGYSLNSISPQEWRAIEKHDTIGFNWFVHQSFVRCDYQFVREIVDNDLDASWRKDIPAYFDLVRSRPQYANTVFLVQTGFRAINGNRAIGCRLIPSNNPIFLWRTLTTRLLPSRSISEGLTHHHGTLSECINFAALLGWRNVVLAGVDLYDRRYFWLQEDEPLWRDSTVDAHHRTAGIVESIRTWRDIFQFEGIHLYVHNPRSLLAQVLPSWQWNE